MGLIHKSVTSFRSGELSGDAAMKWATCKHCGKWITYSPPPTDPPGKPGYWAQRTGVWYHMWCHSGWCNYVNPDYHDQTKAEPR
jgi:hypothetical protein